MSFECPNTNFRLHVRECATNQMLMTQLQEAIQESHNIINDLAGNTSILSQCHKPLSKF